MRWNLAKRVAIPELEKELRQVQAAGLAGVELGQNGIYPSIEQIGVPAQICE